VRGRERRDGERDLCLWYQWRMRAPDRSSVGRGLVQGYHWGGRGALWPGQLRFSVSSRGLYLAAPQRCHCRLYKAMSSLHDDNMSPVLQRHHKIALAKKQITSIDPPPPSLLPVLEMLLAGKREGLLRYRRCCLSDVNCLGRTGQI